MSDDRRCRHIDGDGERCRVEFGLSAAGLCFHHDPERAEERTAARRRGGQASARRHQRERDRAAQQYGAADAATVPPPPKSIKDARDYLAWLTDAGARGDIGAARARDLSTVLDRFIKATEKVGLAARVQALEAKIKAMEGGGK